MKSGFGLYDPKGAPRGGLTVRERARLAVLCFGALALLGSLLYLVSSVRGRLAKEGRFQVPGPTSAPALPPRPPLDREVLLRETRDATAAERLDLESGPLGHLLAAVENLPADPFEGAGVGEPDPGAIGKDPARYRGEIFRTRGRVLSIETVASDPSLPCRPEHGRGAIRREGGDLVFFAVLRDSGTSRDDFVRLDGFFWKVFQGTVDGASATAPLFVGKRLVPSVPASDPVRTLDPSILSRVRDETAAEKERIEEEPYYHLLSFARDGGETDFAAAPELDRERLDDLVAAPAAHRGGAYRLFGGLADAFLRYPASENPARLASIDVGWLLNQATGVVRVDAPPAIVPQGLARGDFVWVHGHFLKSHAYAAVGGETVQAPLFVARRVTRYEEPRSGFGRSMAWIAVATTAASGAWFLAVLRRERRQAAEWRAEVFRRYRERGFRSPSPPRAPVEP
ncbi:MAG TPA: hypothetical protein VFI25_15275 [Planctomycetota bacterium]|nr:hypothetical protein [Planctomycetota bacterium]